MTPYHRFCYQVVYSEKGKPLFEVTSFSDAFAYLVQAADGMSRALVDANTGSRCEPSVALLDRLGWVHRDFTLGNIIVVGTTAKISDSKFAKQREARELDELTKPTDVSLRVVRGTRVVGLSLMSFRNQTDPGQGTLPFVSVEVEARQYLFGRRSRPDLKNDGGMGGPEDRTRLAASVAKRTFLHNPLHDYESIWWIAVWLVCCCKPEGVADHMMKRARR